MKRIVEEVDRNIFLFLVVRNQEEVERSRELEMARRADARSGKKKKKEKESAGRVRGAVACLKLESEDNLGSRILSHSVF